MGVRQVYPGILPAKIARDALGESTEMFRREMARQRRLLYEDNAESVIRREINNLFVDEAVKQRMNKFAKLSGSQALFKRIVNEIARPVYVTPPTRFLSDGQDQLHELAREVRLDARMDHVAHMVVAHNHCWVYVRYVERLKRIVLDVLTPDQVTVIPDPDDPTQVLAIMYDKRVRKADGTYVDWHVFWDDEIVFQMDEHDNVVPFKPGTPPYFVHGYPEIPMQGVHLRERSGLFWDVTGGNDLVAAQIECSLLNLLAMRLLKAQGFNQLTVAGDVGAFPKGQVMDEEHALVVPEGTSVESLNNKSDADHYLSMLDAVKGDAAANHGISRARLNQEGSEFTVFADVGLMEQRADIIKIMRAAELGVFKKLRMVANSEHPIIRIPEEATFSIDFGEVKYRVDPKARLEIWKEELSMGLRSIYDCVRELDPEIEDDEEAKAEISRNAESYAWFIDLFRKLNIRTDGSAEEPGQSPEEMGKMGPMVRDGEMSRDKAAKLATGDKRPVEMKMKA